MDGEKFKELREYVEREMKITPENVQEMTLKLPNMTFRFVNIYATERRVLLSLERKMEKMYSTIYEEVRYHGDYKITSATEADVLVKGHDAYHDVRMTHGQQKIIVDFISDTIDLLKKLNFNISYYLEFTKLKHGVIS